MGATVTKESEDLFAVSLDGILTTNELKEVQDQANAAMDKGQETKVLLLAENFSGWAKEGEEWGDLSFMVEHDPYIQKIAVVTSEKLKDDILLFLGAGMRKAAVEYFPTGEEEKARNWLQE
jgi:hypothetical protein